MKKVLLTIFIISAIITSETAGAIYINKEDNLRQETEIYLSGFNQYPPFGWFEVPLKDENNKRFNTLFMPMLDWLKENGKFKIKSRLNYTDFDELNDSVREGEVDFVIGAYYGAKQYKGLQMVYPAIIYNPISVFMIPTRKAEVKSFDDLKKLKGTRIAGERFTDYVEDNMGQLNITPSNTPFEAFEKLFTKQADYIIGSYYNIMLEAIKLGLKQQIAASKQVIWNVPVFIGISKTSEKREVLSRYLTKYLSSEKNLATIKNNLKEIIEKFERQYDGTVPPSFNQTNSPSDNDTSEKTDNTLDAN